MKKEYLKLISEEQFNQNEKLLMSLNIDVFREIILYTADFQITLEIYDRFSCFHDNGISYISEMLDMSEYSHDNRPSMSSNDMIKLFFTQYTYID